MSNTKHIARKLGFAAAMMLAVTGCTRDIDTEQLAPYPDIADVYIDGFASDMQYQAWGKVTNFSIDNDVKYDGTSSMRIEVPSANDPMGTWAGGNFYSTMGRNLTRYDALTFYAKASVSTSIEVGYGNDGGAADYLVTLKNLKLNTNWQKVIIPIPNAAKLLSEKGLFYYSAGMVSDEGYSIWFDDVKFEKLGLVAHPAIGDVERPAFPGAVEVGKLTATFSLPNGVTQAEEVSPKYFTFSSSDESVASMQGDSIVVHKTGETTLTPNEAEGSIKLNCYDYAPTPKQPADNVLSIFSDTYPAVVGVNMNPYWQYSTAQYQEITSGKEHVGKYSELNFVGIVFNSPVDCSNMHYMHMDLMSLDNVGSGANFACEIQNGKTSATYNLTPAKNADFKKNQWVSIDIPLSAMGTNKTVTQLVLSCGGIKNVLIDNIYFYK